LAAGLESRKPFLFQRGQVFFDEGVEGAVDMLEKSSRQRDTDGGQRKNAGAA